MSYSEPPPSRDFSDLGLSPPVLEALREVGYETPTPIQAETIPLVLAGHDLLGQAQTGTGKTAAFALPLLTRIDVQDRRPQVLALTPTRELAIQVAEALQRYAAHIDGFHVTPIYGGQAYQGQIRHLRRGVHAIVGTPGRVMDHMRRGTLGLDALRCLVLDEADEMLRMGFIDDVEWILDQTPPQRQTLLFSATLPHAIRRIAERHLRDPRQVTIKMRTAAADTVRQRVWMVSGFHKLDALTRILEAEPFDAMLVFVRTRNATLELAERLEARGFPSSPLNGEIPQAQRERTVEQLKNGKVDILVATDVAARGLDVRRISHVVNYDIPYDTEAYIHRIGRTGRAGRPGEAILFVAPRERYLLRNIEKATRHKIDPMELPSTESLNSRRVARFKQRITDTLATEDLDFFVNLVEEYRHEHDTPPALIAAALARLTQGEEPLLLEGRPARREQRREHPAPARKTGKGSARPDETTAPRPQRSAGEPHEPVARPKKGMERFRLEVGRRDGAKPGNIVGAIANEAGIEGKLIGPIRIYDDFSTVDLPLGMPNEIFRDLKKTRVAGQALRISRLAAPERPADLGDPKAAGARKGHQGPAGKDRARRGDGSPPRRKR